MSRDFLSLGAAGHLPQDPYLPQVDPEGPSFLDTAACLCALRATGDGNSDAAWHCIGNQTQGVYTTNSGKWFPTVNGGNAVDGKVDDLSNGPDTSKPMRLSSGSLTDLTNDDGLSVYDQACTGTNRPSFSTTFYAAWNEIQSNQQPKSAAPCYRPDGQAVPIRIVEADDWNANGCAPGFLCKCPSHLSMENLPTDDHRRE